MPLLSREHGEKITDLSHLRKIGIAAPEKTAPYILIDGKRPPVQERLF